MQPRAPSEFHGYDLGRTYTITANLDEYYRHLADESARVPYEEYGRSIQGRPLASLVITSEANLERRDEISRVSRPDGDPGAAS